MKLAQRPKNNPNGAVAKSRRQRAVPLDFVTVQAFVSRANANWSGASYLPGAILVAAWLIRWRAKKCGP